MVQTEEIIIDIITMNFYYPFNLSISIYAILISNSQALWSNKYPIIVMKQQINWILCIRNNCNATVISIVLLQSPHTREYVPVSYTH